MEFVKKYLPIRMFPLANWYFIAVAAFIGIGNYNLWMIVVMLPFIFTSIYNKPTISFFLGSVMTVWSVFMAFALLFDIARGSNGLLFVLGGIILTFLNFYMSLKLALFKNAKSEL